MKRFSPMSVTLILSLVLVLLIGTSSGLRAQEKAPPSSELQKKAEAFLNDVYKLYHVPVRDGLTHMAARLEIKKTQDAALQKLARSLSIDYEWESGGPERIGVEGASAVFRKALKEPLQGIWRDIAGGGVFAFLEDVDMSLEEDGGNVALFLSSGGKPKGKIVFDPDTKLVLRAEGKGLGKGTAVVPAYALSDGRLRLEERRVVSSGKQGREKMRGSYQYSGFRNVNDFMLPTKIIMGIEKDRIELHVEYTRINGKEAVVGEADPERVKALVKEYEKNYSKWGSSEKLEALKKLEETGHEKAAEAIAKRGLKDKDLRVRKESIRTLGAMKCRKVVSTLGKAMKTNKKEPEVYMELIKALGEIGDPRAIPYLKEDIWGDEDDLRGNMSAVAKIDALGEIRSKKSVDALIDLMYVAKPWTMGQVRGALRSSLMRLTGQNFAKDGNFRSERDEWKNWWNKNRNHFKLEED